MKAVLLSLLLCIPAFGANKQMETGKVVSQNVGAYNGGGVATVSGNVAVGAPILRAVNTVVVETQQKRLTLVEITGRNYLLLTVNDPVSYYVDGNHAVIEGANGKKHKFFVTRMEDISQGAR